LPAPVSGLDVLATPGLTGTLPANTAEDADEDWPDEDDELLTFLDHDGENEPAPPARKRGSAIINDTRKGPDQWLR
jgi:hypothetical protein